MIYVFLSHFREQNSWNFLFTVPTPHCILKFCLFLRELFLKMFGKTRQLLTSLHFITSLHYKLTSLGWQVFKRYPQYFILIQGCFFEKNSKIVIDTMSWYIFLMQSFKIFLRIFRTLKYGRYYTCFIDMDIQVLISTILRHKALQELETMP